MTIRALVVEYAAQHKLDPDLVSAIIAVESSFRENVIRYEPEWRYFHHVGMWAGRLSITVETETKLQKMSFGLMQLMGGTARGLGFEGMLTELLLPEVNIRYGCVMLDRLYTKYSKDDRAWSEPVVAAYNAGTPRRGSSGAWTNESYVRRVEKEYKRLKSLF